MVGGRGEFRFSMVCEERGEGGFPFFFMFGSDTMLEFLERTVLNNLNIRVYIIQACFFIRIL